jgi:phenylalanyl-tRNA synthetase alpha chain
MIAYETHENIFHVPTPEGAQISENGSHEARVWSVLPLKGQGNPLTLNGLKEGVGNETAAVGQGRAFKNGWIGKEGNGFVKLVRLFSQSLRQVFKKNCF